MTGIVDPRQRSFFEAYGYLVLPGLLADAIGSVTDGFDAVFADPATPSLEYKVVGHRWHSEFIIADFVERDPRLDRLRSDPRVTGLAADLLGPDAAYANSDASIYRCETEWHYDTPTVDGRRHLKLLLYLDPVDATSGALRVLPASHHDPSLPQGSLAPYLGFDGMIEERTGLAGEDLPHWMLPSEPGDVIALDFGVLHASYGSVETRRKVALNFCSSTGSDLCSDR